MGRLFRYAIAVLALCFPCQSQSVWNPLAKSKSSSSAEHSQLAVVDTVKISSESAEGFNSSEPLRCDADGNSYLRVQTEVEPAIRKFDSKGVQQALFRPSSIPDIKVAFATGFSIDNGGKIHQLVAVSFTDWYVITFKPDGTYKSKARLQAGLRFHPFQLATFPSGEWLISGLRKDEDPNVHVEWPFTGIFSEDGTLLKQVVLQDDDKLRKMVKAGDPAVVSPGRHYGNSAIEQGAADAATDGNVYIMRRLSPAIIYAVSPGGEVIRRFHVGTSDPDSHPASMQIAGNRIAVLFFNSATQKVILEVADLNGHHLATYDRIEGDIGISFVCYSPVRERFTFLTITPDNFLGFAVAEPR